MKALPRLNYRVPITETDESFLSDTYSYEITKRTEIASDYGIVSNTDSINESSPLYVSVNSNKDIVVTVGGAVTPAGHMVFSKKEEKLSIPTFDNEYIVFIEYDTVGIDERATRYNTYENSIFQRKEDASELVQGSQYDSDITVCDTGNIFSVVKMDRESNLIRTDLYPADRLNNIVKLAKVSKARETAGEESSDVVVTINLVGTDIRPWYSPKDNWHRSRLGSGMQTDNNAHAMAVSDLTIGDLSLFDVVEHGGFIVSKDIDFTQHPGRKVLISVSGSKLETGLFLRATESPTINSQGQYGENIKPMKIGIVYSSASGQSKQFPFVYKPQTGYIQGIGCASETTVTIEGYVVDALTPIDPIATSTNSIKVLPPTDTEIIITGGIAINTLKQDEVSLNGNIVEREFMCYATSEETIISNPSILKLIGEVAGVSTGEKQTLQYDDLDSSYIEIGVRTDTIETPSFTVEIEGTLSSGGTGSDEIIITDSDMSTITTDTSHKSGVFRSTKLFSSITSWKIIENSLNIIPASTSMVVFQYRNYDSRRQLASFCKVFHSGFNIISIADTRRISYRLNPPKPTPGLTSPLTTVLGASDEEVKVIAEETMNGLKWIDTYTSKDVDSLLDSVLYYSKPIPLPSTVSDGDKLVITIKPLSWGSIDSIDLLVNGVSTGLVSNPGSSDVTDDYVRYIYTLSGVIVTSKVTVSIRGSFYGYSITYYKS